MRVQQGEFAVKRIGGKLGIDARTATIQRHISLSLRFFHPENFLCLDGFITSAVSPTRNAHHLENFPRIKFRNVEIFVTSKTPITAKFSSPLKVASPLKVLPPPNVSSSPKVSPPQKFRHPGGGRGPVPSKLFNPQALLIPPFD
jgi:hypothetical protein